MQTIYNLSDVHVKVIPYSKLHICICISAALVSYYLSVFKASFLHFATVIVITVVYGPINVLLVSLKEPGCAHPVTFSAASQALITSLNAFPSPQFCNRGLPFTQTKYR